MWTSIWRPTGGLCLTSPGPHWRRPEVDFSMVFISRTASPGSPKRALQEAAYEASDVEWRGAARSDAELVQNSRSEEVALNLLRRREASPEKNPRTRLNVASTMADRETYREAIGRRFCHLPQAS